MAKVDELVKSQKTIKISRLRFFSLYLLVFLVSACAESLPPVDDQVKPPSAESQLSLPAKEEKTNIVQEVFSFKQPKDEELFLLGLSLLSESLTKNDYSEVKHPLETLVNSYPKSKWRDAASMFLRLIGEMENFRDKLRSEAALLNKTLADKARTLQDNEQQKKEIRLLNEKFQAEITILQQENEQLKKDILLLKNLEIQLDKREKMLR